MPDRENVECGVEIPVVYDTAGAARPFSYSKVRSALRTAGRECSTGRADLGRVPFRDFPYLNAGLLAFVPQHCFENAPTGVPGGLRQFGLADSSGGDIPDVDRGRGVDDLAGELVQAVLPLSFDLPMESGSLLAMPCSLSNSKAILSTAVPTRVLKTVAVGTDGDLFESEVDADGIPAGMGSRAYEHLYTEVPVSAGVLREAARSEDEVGEAVRIPDTEVAPGETYGAGAPFRAAGLEWDPTQGSFPSVSLAPAESGAFCDSALAGVDVADFVNCDGTDQIEFKAGADRERMEIESRQGASLPVGTLRSDGR